MPRSSKYLLPGYTYHLTHRCHNREFLLRFSRECDAYREWLRQGVERHGVSVFGFCVTGNHVHIVVHVTEVQPVSAMMQLASGATAKQYNVRKERAGSMWEHPYHCTIVQNGQHLVNCLRYIDLNMVRAGRVSHPREWRWCGYDELVGMRQRYRIIDIDRLLTHVGAASAREFHAWYAGFVEQHLTTGELLREPCWTEPLAVGSEDFVRTVEGHYKNRQIYRIDKSVLTDDTVWTIREPHASYGAYTEPKIAL